MKLSTLWLSEWVDVSLTEQQLANQLTMAGLEVDALSPVSGAFTNVLVAQVLNTKPHPDADKLTVCEVSVGTNKTLQIVCGAQNVRPELKVALAMLGACLPGEFRIKETKLRGVLSQGMLCSLSELGLAESSEGIMELDEDAPIGMNLRDYLKLDDFILSLDLTPNRADCFSMLGLAREVAALNHVSFVEPLIYKISTSIDDVLKINIHQSKACPRYCGRIIRAINSNAKTPLWMRERLRRCGMRSIHPVVDVMNYVMLELGQPMHAFDLAKIQGDIQVRFADNAEEIQLLDEEEIHLTDKDLVIADTKKPLALAGVMGGAFSAVGQETRDIFLESAFFDPIIIAGVARKFGLFSDSSQRFERGVDPYLQMKALERATNLIVSIAGGHVGPIVESQNSDLPPPISFIFNPSLVKKITGLDLSFEKIKQLLEGLGFILHPAQGNCFEVFVPSHRFDIQLEVDLVEEILRVHGYDALETQMTYARVHAGQSSPIETLLLRLALWFRDRGYHETISYSFVDPDLQAALYPEKQGLQLLNPISSELSQMRLSLWPGLIASMIYNTNRQQNAFKLFETGVVFELDNKQLVERPCIAGLIVGETGGLNWSEKTRCFDFYDLKGDLESLFSLLQLNPVEFIAASHDALHPGQSAKIVIQGKEAGWIGVLHPRLSDAFDVPENVILFELYLESMIQPKRLLYKPISKYPHVRRDLSFLIDEAIGTKAVEAVVRSCIQEHWLKNFEVFDVYKGANVPAGKKSLAIAMILQDDNRTLQDSEINLLIHAIISSLETHFSILLRD